MSTPRRILVPVDLTTESFDALEYALELAAPLGAGVDLLDVAEPAHREESGRELEEILWALRRRGFVAVRGLVESGDPARTLVEVAAREGHVLIVLPASRRGLARLLARDSIDRLVARAPCPVLVVPGPSTLSAHPSAVVETWAEQAVG